MLFLWRSFWVILPQVRAAGYKGFFRYARICVLLEPLELLLIGLERSQARRRDIQRRTMSA